MIVIFEHDELLNCDKCAGVGVIPVDLYEHTDEGFGVTRSYSFVCGVCDGEGQVMPSFEVEVGAND